MPPKLKNSAYDAKHFKFTYYLINRVVISITALITAGLLGDELDQNGALGRDRTDDNQFTKLVLYQLSYKGEIDPAVI